MLEVAGAVAIGILAAKAVASVYGKAVNSASERALDAFMASEFDSPEEKFFGKLIDIFAAIS